MKMAFLAPATWHDSARGHVTSQSRQSREVGGAIANASFYALVEDEPPFIDL